MGLSPSRICGSPHCRSEAVGFDIAQEKFLPRVESVVAATTTGELSPREVPDVHRAQAVLQIVLHLRERLARNLRSTDHHRRLPFARIAGPPPAKSKPFRKLRPSLT